MGGRAGDRDRRLKGEGSQQVGRGFGGVGVCGWPLGGGDRLQGWAGSLSRWRSKGMSFQEERDCV